MSKPKVVKTALYSNPKIEYPSYEQLPTEKKSTSVKLKNSLSRRVENNDPENKSIDVKSVVSRAIDCNCGPDFYNRILGPTADEAFLKGVLTIFEICRRFTSCKDKPEPVKSSPKMVTEMLEIVGIPPEIAEKSLADLAKENPVLLSKILQTSNPEMISEMLQVQLGAPEIETVSTSMQTSDHNLPQKPKKMCVCSKCQNALPESHIEIEETATGTKKCICCSCYKADCATESSYVSEKSCGADVDKWRCCYEEPAPKTKLCRCYECAAPVLYKPGYKSRTKCKCCPSSRNRSRSGTYLPLPKCDTCSMVDTSCSVQKRIYYF